MAEWYTEPSFWALIGTLVAVLTLAYTVRHSQKFLIIKSFAVLVSDLASDTVRHDRNILFKQSKEMNELLENYDKKDEHPGLVELDEAAIRTASTYDSLGFILKKDNKLAKEVIDFHGFTIGKIWMIIEPLHKVWKERDYQGFDYFYIIGRASYEDPRFKNKIDQFMEKYRKN